MKKPKEIELSPLFDKIISKTPKDSKIYVSKSLHIASQILAIMERKKILQKDLAGRLGKSEAEISKWLCGSHNFTIRTISKIEAELDETIITTPKKVFEDLGEVINNFVSNFNKTVKVNAPVFQKTKGIEINTVMHKPDCKVVVFIPAHLKKAEINTEELTGTFS